MTSLLLSMALALLGNLATNTVRIEQPWWPPAVWVTVGLLVLWAMAHAASSQRAEPDATPANPVDQAKEWLIAQEKDLRTRDVERAQLRRPVPLRVRWSSTSRPVVATPSAVLNMSADIGWRDSPLTGDIRGIVTDFRKLPNRQLVILGEAGAGKSSLATLLGLGLLDRRQTALAKSDTDDKDHPIPVYLSIASWHPAREHIEAFVVRRLHEQFEFPSGVPAEYGICLADILLDKGCLLPVLDGLDELPIELRAAAIEELEAFAAAARPFVLTCRTAEYEQAVAQSGLVLSRAAVIEIEPVDVEAAITFLSGSIPSTERWTDVFTHLRHSSGSPLAQVLSTPLMVSLARIAYRPTQTDPSVLLGLPDFTTIAGTLLDQYISTAYPAPRRQRRGRARTDCGYAPEKVTRWLAFLAHHLYQSGRRDLRWWQLTPALLPRVLQWKRLLPDLAALLMLVTTLTGGLLFGAWTAPGLAVLATVVISIGTSGLFSALWPTRYQLPEKLPANATTRLCFGLLIGVLGGAVAAKPPTGLGRVPWIM